MDLALPSWPRCLKAMVLVKPATVVQWHQQAPSLSGECLRVAGIEASSGAAANRRRHRRLRYCASSMYSSVVLLPVGMSLWLGSYAAELLSILPIVAFH